LIDVHQSLLGEYVIEYRGVRVIKLFLFLQLLIILKVIVVGLSLNERLIQFRFSLPICSGKKLLLKAAQVI
jgi:hypothetical protein